MHAGANSLIRSFSIINKELGKRTDLLAPPTPSRRQSESSHFLVAVLFSLALQVFLLAGLIIFGTHNPHYPTLYVIERKLMVFERGQAAFPPAREQPQISSLGRELLPCDGRATAVTSQAFKLLKEELTSSPVLALYNPAAETELHTDASSIGLGAILLQKQKNGAWCPIAFFSQATNKAETNYHSFELEMLAIVRAIERFHIYLFGLSFTVVTDCNALVYAINKANLNPRIARWTLTLQNYDFKVTHRPGRKMAHVDALSRCVGYVNELPLERELEFRQLTDPRIKEIYNELEYKCNDKFELIDGLVYKLENNNRKFVIPDSMIMSVIRAHHDNMAHCGLEKTMQGIRQNYWFPAMRKKINDYIDNCLTCLMSNDSAHRKEGETSLYPSPTAPLEILHVDHFGPLPESENKYKHILVVVDAFTRFTWLCAAKSTSSRETIKLLEDIFNMFGKPIELVSDRGTAFTSSEFSKFAEINKIKHRKVAVAAPWANGLVERVNRFIKTSLTKMLSSTADWKRELGSLQYIINNTYHSVTKASPAKLLLGIDQRNHDDSALARFTKALADVDANLETERELARDMARKASDMIRSYNKKYRDTRMKKVTVYKEGDFVMVRNIGAKPGESGKLKPNYRGPYLIYKILGNNRYVVTDIPGHNIKAKPLNTILSSDKIKPWVRIGPLENEISEN